MAAAPKPLCKDCTWWDPETKKPPSAQYAMEDVGRCMFNPPLFLIPQGSQWPRVKGRDWCAHWAGSAGTK